MEESCRQAIACVYAALCMASGDDVRRRANDMIAFALDHGSVPDSDAHFVLRELVHGNSLEFDTKPPTAEFSATKERLPTMTDATKGESTAETGPSKVLNSAKQSRTDVGDTYRPDSEAHIAQVLKKSLSQPNQATYSRGKR